MGGRSSDTAICAICAERPTVRSHIVPRALFHDAKRPNRGIILGGLEDGYRVTQSGKLDEGILCEPHERELGQADTYGVAFCRDWRRLSTDQVGRIMVPNPKPELLTDFILACVWRMAASRTGGRPSLALGRFADLMEGRLFGPGEGCDPPVFVESFEIDDGTGSPLVMGLLPTPAQSPAGLWHFIISGLRFVVDFSGTSGVALERVNNLAAVPIAREGLRSVDEIEGLRPSLTRMSMPRRRPPS